MPVRYRPVWKVNNRVGMSEAKFGQWVRFTDYQRVAERLEALENAAESLCELAEEYGPLGKDSMTCQHVRKLLAAPEVES